MSGAQWGYHCIWLRACSLVSLKPSTILNPADVVSGWTRRVMKQFWMGNLRLVSLMLNTLESWCLLILGFRIEDEGVLIISSLTRWSQGLIYCSCSISKQFRRGNMGLVSAMPRKLMLLLMYLAWLVTEDYLEWPSYGIWNNYKSIGEHT